MLMRSQFDVAIIGAGLAGLSLAVRLAALPKPPSIVLIDRRHDYSCDHIWCHWAGIPHPFANCISHRWAQWTVGRGSDFTLRSDPLRPYQRIPADLLYHEAQLRLSHPAKVEWKLGLQVSEVLARSSGATITCEGGSEIDAQWVFDSRPPPHQLPSWSQKFRGLEIELQTPTSDLSTVKLMDFQFAGSAGIRFFYVLPLSSTSVFVEDTWLAPPGINPEFSDAAIIDYARKNLGPCSGKITHREEGSIPMSALGRSREIGPIIRIGAAGGAIRASSGYAFSRIQQESEALAAAYAGGQLPLRRDQMLDWFDAIFLTVLQQYPERMPEYFQRLFERVPPPRLVRFMESRPLLLDLLAVMRALPPWPFLQAAGGLLRTTLR